MEQLCSLDRPKTPLHWKLSRDLDVCLRFSKMAVEQNLCVKYVPVTSDDSTWIQAESAIIFIQTSPLFYTKSCNKFQ